MRRMQGGKNPNCINNGADIWAVEAGSANRRIAQLVHQVTTGAASQLVYPVGGIGIVQNQTVGMLREAWGLLICRLVETLLIEPDTQNRGCLLRSILE